MHTLIHSTVTLCCVAHTHGQHTSNTLADTDMQHAKDVVGSKSTTTRNMPQSLYAGALSSDRRGCLQQVFNYKLMPEAEQLLEERIRRDEAEDA